MFPSEFEIIDISKPINSRTACYPGDTMFSRRIALDIACGGAFNASVMTMSPHVGTHADSLSHLTGTIEDVSTNIGASPLYPYIGRCIVVDLSPMAGGAVTAERLRSVVSEQSDGIERVLIKTATAVEYDKWLGDYAYIGLDAVVYLQSIGTKLLGIDTPSVDSIRAEKLIAHDALAEAGLTWLESLDLSRATAGTYFLVAAPLRFEELEASPVRALLLR